MAFIIKGMRDFNEFLNKYEDPRTSGWFLISSPFYTLAICISYVIIVKKLLPRLMEDRKPFELKNVLIFYNFMQVILSTWLFYRISSDGWLSGNYNWICQPPDYTNQPATMRNIDTAYWYYISKFTEFFDTFFFIMRKKYNQVTTLHVIHHGIMPMSVWFGIKFVPEGHGTFFGFLNTFVHIIMYSYYMLSAFGPKIQKYLWWKKYLTAIQMIQFVLVFIHSMQLLFIDCDYHRGICVFIAFHGGLFLILFKAFYNEAYSYKKEPVSKTPTKNNNTHSLKNHGSKPSHNYQFRNSVDTEMKRRNEHASEYLVHGNISMEIERNVK